MADVAIQAGPRALAHIRANGLSANDITIVPGAAGGPKGLGLAKLDEWLFADWLPTSFATRTKPINLIGASIGAWRFASVCKGAPGGVFSSQATRAGLRALADAYCEQRYPKNTNAAFVSGTARDLIRDLFVGQIGDVLSHPHYRLNLLAVRGKGLLARDVPGRTHVGFAAATVANLGGRRHLRHFLDRVWFTANSPETSAPIGVSPLFAAQFDAFHTDYATLTETNFSDALVSSGSIPLVMQGVSNIVGAPRGTYWDGGIIDYHLSLPYAAHAGLTLYPHFTHTITPGWLDKAVPWRRARGHDLDSLILISPTADYLARLPNARLPDRGDFKRYADDADTRIKHWRTAMAESERLRDEVAKAFSSDRLADLITPLP